MQTRPVKPNNYDFGNLECSQLTTHKKAKHNAIPLSSERVEYLRFRQKVRKTLNCTLGREPFHSELDTRIRQLKMSAHRERMALI